MAMQTRHKGYILQRAFTYADINGTSAPILDIPAGVFVRKVALIITTAFSGGVPSIDVGDGDDADGWIDTGDITEGTKGAYVGDETTTSHYCLGKWYETADTIDVADSGAACTAGAATLIAECIDINDEG